MKKEGRSSVWNDLLELEYHDDDGDGDGDGDDKKRVANAVKLPGSCTITVS